jgi:hypothetical protein
MQKYHIPIDCEPTYFESIGELATRWGWIENQASVLIRVMLKLTRPESNMAIHSVGMNQKTRVIANLARHLFKTNKKLGEDLCVLAAEIQEFEKFRNDVIHGLWVHAPQTSKQVALLRRKSLEQRIDPHPDAGIATEFPSKLTKLKEMQYEAQRLTTALKHLKGKFS